MIDVANLWKVTNCGRSQISHLTILINGPHYFAVILSSFLQMNLGCVLIQLKVNMKIMVVST